MKFRYNEDEIQRIGCLFKSLDVTVMDNGLMDQSESKITQGEEGDYGD